MAMSVLDQIFGVTLPVDLPRLKSAEVLGFRKRKRELTNSYKKKATAAVAKLKPFTQQNREERSYFAHFGDNFDFRESSDGALCVHSTTSDGLWSISVGERGADFCAEESFQIEVFPNRERPWSLGQTVVRLRGFGPISQLYSATWKAFESELIAHQIKADLVQLSEYYQYSPRFLCRIQLPDNLGWEWQALSRVVMGFGTRATLHSSDLARLLEIDEKHVVQFVTFLKGYGYEARSTATNPQIMEGHFLIPYAFPTLSPSSVQLRKKISQ